MNRSREEMLAPVWVALVYIVCGEWLSLFAKGEYAGEVHSGIALKTHWLSNRKGE